MKKQLWLAFFVFFLFSLPIYAVKEFTYKETDLVILSLNASDPDNDNLIYTFSTPVNNEGKWQTTYTDAGEYTINVSVSDGTTQITEKIKIIVLKKEESPTIKSYSPNKIITIDEKTRQIFTVTAIDLNKDKLSYEWELNEEKVSDKEEYEYITDYFSAGEHTVKVTISDGESDVSQEWNIKVNNVDRPAAFKPLKTIWINENQAVTINLTAYDPDNEEITFTADMLPENAVLSENTLSWQTDYNTVTKESIMDKVTSKLHLLRKSFDIEIYANSNNLQTKQMVKIIVSDINRAPVIEDLAEITVNEGETININAVASDPDGDNIRVSYSGFMDKQSYISNFEDAGEYIVTITASDGFLTTTKDLNIIIKNVNRAPIIDIENMEVEEGKEIEIKLTADDPDNGFNDITSDLLPENSSLKENIFKWTPDHDIASKDKKNITILFKASDGISEAQKEAIFTVKNVNRPPEILNFSPEHKEFTTIKNFKIPFKIIAKDHDGDKLTYIWKFGLLDKVNATALHNRIFTQPGIKNVEVIVSDGKDTTSHKWKLLVKQ